MAKKTNWRKRAIESMLEQGIDRANAARIFSSAYQQARRKVRKETSDKNINLTFETYNALIGRADSLIDVTLSDDKIKVTTQLRYRGEDLEQAYLNARFDRMASSYEEVAELLDAYNEGELSYRDFIEAIQEFKDTNPKYWRGRS